MKKLFLLLFALLSCATCWAAEPAPKEAKIPTPTPPQPAIAALPALDGNADITDLVFILDKSGSMCGLESDTIGGFNAMLDKQREEQGGEVFVSCVLFNNESKLLYDRVPLDSLQPMTRKDYFVGGTTALLDAAGNEMNRLEKVYADLDGNAPGKVLFVIITDGKENASREYTQPKIKQMIEQRQKERGWEFIFLGANIDAVSVANGYGINAEHAANYHNDSQGVANNFLAVSEAASDMRREGRVSGSWSQKVNEDYSARK